MWIIASILFLYTASVAHSFTIDIEDHWDLYKENFEKVYATPQEEQKHKRVFENNVAFIIKHNLQENMNLHTYWLGINERTDWIDEDIGQPEVKPYVPSFVVDKKPTENETELVVLEKLDYNKKGWISKVESQGKCNAGYAFAIAGAIDAQIANTSNKKSSAFSASVQYLMDCSMWDGNKGCKWGIPKNVYILLRSNDDIYSTDKYPYTEKDGICLEKCHRDNYIHMFTSVYNITTGEEGMHAALKDSGPLVVGISSKATTFQNFKGGIYADAKCKATEIDHYALITGFGVQNGMQYWLLKNSYGEKWGEGGYMKVKYSEDICRISEQASYLYACFPSSISEMDELWTIGRNAKKYRNLNCFYALSKKFS